MKINFEYPSQIRQYAEDESIMIEDIERAIRTLIGDYLINDNNEPIELEEIRIVVNGLHKDKRKKVYVKPSEISPETPFRTSSLTGTNNRSSPLYSGCSINYLIFKAE